MRFEYELVPEWPLLAWLAKWQKSGTTITVQHGARVEINDEWFCEAVWAGDYAAGDFDRTDIVAGSGSRIRGEATIFVSSGSMVDRLVSIEAKGAFFVSNSLPCLLVAVDGSIDPSYRGYFEDFNSVIDGLDKYCPTLNTSSGPVRFTYFNNLAWNGEKIETLPKPFPQRDFSSFEHYRGFLSNSMGLLAKNMAAAQRKNPYRMLGTLSSGYDSPTVTTLAKEAGCSEVICIDKGLWDVEEDGEAIAAVLGVQPLRIRRADWRECHIPEPPFIVGDSMGQDLTFKGAEGFLSGRVLLTGYHGDKAWQKGGKYLSLNIVRGDMSGLSLTEYRLGAGFIHCPIAFWGIRQIRDLHALTNSPEMKPWDIAGTFKDYSRPICRRIVEEAGVPREMFGQKKSGGSVLFDELLNPASMESYLRWLKANRGAWLKHGRLPPPASSKLETWLRRSRDGLKGILRRAPILWRLARDPLEADISPSWLRRYVFPWAMELQKARYRRQQVNRL